MFNKNLFLLLTCIDFIHNKNLSLLQILIIGGWNKYFRYKKYIKYTLQVTNCAAVSNGEIGFCIITLLMKIKEIATLIVIVKIVG